MKRRNLVVVSDGSCRGNPGPMGYAAIIQDLDSGEEITTTGAATHGTNGRAELLGVIEGVRAAIAWCEGRPRPNLVIRADATYISYALDHSWRATKLQKGAANLDLLQAFHEILEPYTVDADDVDGGPSIRFQWVQGHNGDELNERADELAKGACNKLMEGIKVSNRQLPKRPYEEPEETLSTELTPPAQKVPRYKLRRSISPQS